MKLGIAYKMYCYVYVYKNMYSIVVRSDRRVLSKEAQKDINVKIIKKAKISMAA